MRCVVLSQPRTGTHFVVRSLAKSYNIPYGMTDEKITLRTIDDKPSWVIGSHSEYSDELKNYVNSFNSSMVCIYRNPVDHALSIVQNIEEIGTGEFLKRLKGPWFKEIRKKVLSYPKEITVSYDLLSKGDEQEVSRLREITGFYNLESMEDIEITRSALGPIQAMFGISGRWQQVISTEMAMDICDYVGEDLPEIN